MNQVLKNIAVCLITSLCGLLMTGSASFVLPLATGALFTAAMDPRLTGAVSTWVKHMDIGLFAWLNLRDEGATQNTRRDNGVYRGDLSRM